MPSDRSGDRNDIALARTTPGVERASGVYADATRYFWSAPKNAAMRRRPSDNCACEFAYESRM